MFCVIQEVERKRANRYGAYQKIEAYSYTIEIPGQPKRTVYAYCQSSERFERPIRTAYKVSIHESKRVNGVVTKRQYPVTTAGYYDLAEGWIGDCILGGKLEAIAADLNTSTEYLWELISAKVDPLEERIKAEYQQTEEFQASVRHAAILANYRVEKDAFNKRHGDYYDYCYNVFGEVMNQAYLDEIMASAKQREQAYSSYYESASGNYDYSHLFTSASVTYSDGEKAMLHKFYRSLSKQFHPDLNRDTDTHAEMILLNKLKQDWGI